MDWGQAVSAIGKAAPLIGSLFGPAGTVAGALAGTGLTLAARALGVEPTEDAVTQAITTDPEAALKLRQFEMEHRIELEKLEIRKYELALADTQGARTRQVESEKATGKRDTNLYVLAWVIVVGFFALMGLLLKYPVPEDQNGVIFMLFGALSAGFGTVLQYFFGSSKGSDIKTELMGQVRKAAFNK